VHFDFALPQAKLVRENISKKQNKKHL